MERSFVSKWIQAIRPFAYPTTFVSCLIGAFYAVYFYKTWFSFYDWFIWFLTTLVAFLFHTGANVVSEYFDFKKGVDRIDTLGSSGILVNNIMTPKQILKGGIIFLIIGAILGIIVFFLRNGNVNFLILGLIGFLGAFFYTGWPVNYKYLGLGDLGVFIVFGPVLASATFLAISDKFHVNIIYSGIIIGMLVVSILHANNFRDIKQDSRANIKTFAMLLGEKGSKIYYSFLVLGVYVLSALFIFLKIIPLWSFIIVLAVPMTLNNVKKINSGSIENPQPIAMMDMFSAKNLMNFGLLYVIGIIIGYFK